MEVAKDYQLYTEYQSYSELKKLDFIVSNIEEYKGNKQAYNVSIMEIGCGRGNISFPLASLGYKIHGIDLNPNAISYIAESNRFPNASFEVGDAEKIEFEDQWDVVICSEIFEHLSLPQNLIRILPGIVKKDGIIVITIPNGYGPYELFYEIPSRPMLKLFNSLLAGTNSSIDLSIHKQNFTLNAFSSLLGGSICIDKVRHSDFMSFWPIIRRIDFLVRIDCKIADLLPHYIVSGWYFVCKLK